VVLGLIKDIEVVQAIVIATDNGTHIISELSPWK
jgi:hypothetical protein